MWFFRLKNNLQPLKSYRLDSTYPPIEFAFPPLTNTSYMNWPKWASLFTRGILMQNWWAPRFNFATCRLACLLVGISVWTLDKNNSPGFFNRLFQFAFHCLGFIIYFLIRLVHFLMCRPTFLLLIFSLIDLHKTNRAAHSKHPQIMVWFLLLSVVDTLTTIEV